MKKCSLSLMFPLMLTVLIAGCVTQAPKEADSNACQCNKQLNQASVTAWANEAVISLYAYNFANYQQQLDKASRYFTPQAWKNFKDALDKSGKLQEVIQKNMITTVAVQSAPVILKQDSQSWTVQMPVLVTYQNATVHKEQHLIVTMRIAKSENFGERGLAINNINAITAYSR